MVDKYKWNTFVTKYIFILIAGQTLEVQIVLG